MDVVITRRTSSHKKRYQMLKRILHARQLLPGASPRLFSLHAMQLVPGDSTLSVPSSCSAAIHLHCRSVAHCRTGDNGKQHSAASSPAPQVGPAPPEKSNFGVKKVKAPAKNIEKSLITCFASLQKITSQTNIISGASVFLCTGMTTYLKFFLSS